MAKNKFKPMKARFRATFSGSMLGANRVGSVDKENEVLHDVQITLEGEALGHGVWLDKEFCQAVADAGNATGDVGLKVRYGHPSMCADAIGTELGRAKNFRVVEVEREVNGEKVKCSGVVADVHLLKSAHDAPQGDIAGHVLSVAAEDPKQFGQSIVFTYADWVVKDADGVRHSYREEVMGVDADGNEIVDDSGKKKGTISSSDWKAQSADGKEYAVLGKLHGSDFTDTPAATDGIFSTGTLAEEAEQMFDEHPEIFDAIENSPKSLCEFLERTGLDKKLESARVSGLQAAKDKEIAELNAKAKEAADAFAAKEKEFLGKIDSLTKELEAAKAETSALQKKVDETAGELATAKSDLQAARDRLSSVESAHRKLTGGALTVGEGQDTGAKTFAEFYKDHGGDFSKAVKADPATYKRLCAKYGMEPIALKFA